MLVVLLTKTLRSPTFTLIVCLAVSLQNRDSNLDMAKKNQRKASSLLQLSDNGVYVVSLSKHQIKRV